MILRVMGWHCLFDPTPTLNIKDSHNPRLVLVPESYLEAVRLKWVEE
jgi:hypothetical protein